MKEIVTKNRSLLDETEALLNNQVAMESKASAIYLAMASWCEVHGYENSANFLYKHTDEERMHMMKIIRYINEAGGHALHPEITGIPNNFKSLRGVFEEVLDHEIAVTKAINNLVDHCYQVKDFTTMNFLQWYVVEQREEETLSRRVLEIFNIIGEEGMGLWNIDLEIGKLGNGAAADTAQ